MRIGIVCYPTFGGSGVVATELGKELALEGHDVHFITYDLPVRFDHFISNLHYHEVVVNDYPLFDYQPYELVLASRMVDVVKHEQLDLLHVHYAIPHASAAYMAREILRSQGINIPFITTLHGTDITLVGKDASFEPVITFAINQSNAVTAVSESLKEDTYQHFNVNREIEVIPNFIDLSRYEGCSTEGVTKAFAPNGERILFHASNFRPVKRVEDAIRVFSKVREEIPCKMLFAGDGPDRPKIEALCRQLGTCKDVHFLGKLKHIEEVYSVADAFILPSETESFGLAALEAMASHVPVISSNTGGIPEINIHGETGFMSNVGDIDDMTANTLKLLKDDELMAKMRQRAYLRAKEFSKDSIIPMYERLYERTLADSKPNQNA
ncbi:MAG: N-acetyl-alpha-D-glucosaminyl L-malate synthase BshA [Flavobacteriales bacterium]|nr:N-acetyl-alpha-D-glucosaminyl L-malate synthase BshA [Flavobacteriales bacterium]